LFGDLERCQLRPGNIHSDIVPNPPVGPPSLASEASIPSGRTAGLRRAWQHYEPKSGGTKHTITELSGGLMYAAFGLYVGELTDPPVAQA
jgi:hypothetical protein